MNIVAFTFLHIFTPSLQFLSCFMMICGKMWINMEMVIYHFTNLRHTSWEIILMMNYVNDATKISKIVVYGTLFQDHGSCKILLTPLDSCPIDFTLADKTQFGILERKLIAESMASY